MKNFLLMLISVFIIAIWFSIHPLPLVSQTTTGEFYITAISPNGEMLAGASTSGLLPIWNTETGATLFDLDNAGTPLPLSVAWSPDSARIATAGGDNIIRIWCSDTRTSSECVQGRLLHELKGHEDPITAIAWSNDNLLASGGQVEDFTVRIWDMTTYQQINQASLGFVRQLAWSPTSNLLAKVSDGGNVLIVDGAFPPNQDISLSVVNPAGIEAFSVAWNKDGTKLAYGTTDGQIRIIDVATRKETDGWMAHNGKIYALAWNLDDLRIASSGDDGTVQTRNMHNDRETLFCAPNRAAVILQIAWNVDGTILYYPNKGSIPTGLPFSTPVDEEPENNAILCYPPTPINRVWNSKS